LAAVPAYHLSALAALRVRDPEAAVRQQPGDGLAARAVLANRLAEGAEPELEPAHLRTALRNRPLAADLIAMHGLLLDAQGKPQPALETMRLANRVSRRSAPANLWLIEAASASGNVPAAVRHYHAALAVHPELEKLLLPILAQGIAYSEVREALKPYLAQPSRWTGAFLDEASRTGNPADLAALLQPLPAGLLSEDYQPRLAAILHRLAVEQGGEAAARFAGQIVPGFVPGTLTRLGFSPETRDPRLGSLAWNLQGSDRIVVDVREGQMLEATAQPLSRGPVAVRDMLVQGGQSYVLRQRVSFGSEAAKAGLRWSAECVGKEAAKPIWNQQVPASQEPVRYRSVVKVPSDCSVMRLTLHLVGPDGQLPATISLGELDLAQQP
jgi:hypothetical protein